MRTAKQIAEYILTLSNPGEGDIISHLKLQKLLYYCQGFHLAIYDRPLFFETIEHWDHGPVVPDLYHEFKIHGSSALPLPTDFDFTQLTEDEKTLIHEIYDAHGQFSAWKLRQMTHQEPPWLNTDTCETISHNLLKEYFITQLLS